MRYRSELGRYLNSLRLVGVGVEVGVHTGRYSYQILRYWRGRELWLVDPWRHEDDYFDSCNASDRIMERRWELAHHRLRRWKRRTRWIRDRSENAAKLFRPNSCDFIYIDANHGYEHVRTDLRLWFPKLRSGGLFCGHDYFDALPDKDLEPIIKEGIPVHELTSYGVKSAVSEFARTIGRTPALTDEKYPTWYFTK